MGFHKATQQKIISLTTFIRNPKLFVLNIEWLIASPLFFTGKVEFYNFIAIVNNNDICLKVTFKKRQKSPHNMWCAI